MRLYQRIYCRNNDYVSNTIIYIKKGDERGNPKLNVMNTKGLSSSSKSIKVLD